MFSKHFSSLYIILQFVSIISQGEDQQTFSSRRGETTNSETPLDVEEEALFHNTRKSGKNKNVIAPDRARNQERLCWRGPAAIVDLAWIVIHLSVSSSVAVLVAR